VLCLVAALAALLWLRGERSPTRRPGRARRRAWGPLTAVRRLLDVVVVGVLLLWTLITPMTGDDGYYAAMARNAPLEGYVGNYYQLLNQSFTPFTWFYRLLGWWEQWTGAAPALLRVPALLAGLATYAMATRLVAAAPYPGQRLRTVAHALLGVSFLAWWLPYDMGVRPESMVALAGTGTLLAVLTALRRQSLVWAGVAVLVAAVGFVCHPTGFVALAPLIAALPRLSRLVRSGRLLHTLARAVCVVAPGAVAGVIAFGDGTLRDFVRGQEIFLAAQDQLGWTDEIQRYSMLLGPDFMGAYAKRLPVLLTLLALAGWLLLAAAWRARGRPLPTVLHLSALSFGLSLLLLWLTPSKWSFHFGSLAGVGAVFLTLLLCGLPRLARRAVPQRVLPAPVVLAAAVAGVLAVALSLVGPNSWPSSWMLGVPQADEPPSLLGVGLGRPAGWALLLALATVLAWWWTRRRTRRTSEGSPDGAAGERGPWRAALTRVLPVVLVAALVLDAGYLVGSFGYAAFRPQASWTPWGDTLRDPLAEDCHASGAFQVLDDVSAQPLADVPGTPASPADGAVFAEGSGWYGAVPPASTAGRIWGSLQFPQLDGATGSFETGWSQLPAVDPAQQRVALTVAGNLGPGNGLVAQYGRSGAGGVEVVAQQDLADGIDSPYWRTVQLDPRVADRAGADAVRLVARDGTTAGGGWLAFSEPELRNWVPVEEHLGGDEPVAVAWQIALLFPCQEQPRVQHGITEPVEHGILYGPSPAAALADATWLVDRGGLYAPVLREASVTALPTVLPGARRVRDVQVYRFENPYPDGRYTLTPRTTTVPGWAAPPGWGDRPAR
jgi:Mycobacterial cell wall arabinan synthesis protein/EmbC C-terminal domain